MPGGVEGRCSRYQRQHFERIVYDLSGTLGGWLQGASSALAAQGGVAIIYSDGNDRDSLSTHAHLDTVGLDPDVIGSTDMEVSLTVGDTTLELQNETVWKLNLTSRSLAP